MQEAVNKSEVQNFKSKVPVYSLFYLACFSQEATKYIYEGGGQRRALGEGREKCTGGMEKCTSVRETDTDRKMFILEMVPN